ncbi:MAG: hypothetical protein ACLQU3_24005 [Limisphaerales bacterium]
MKFYVFEDDEAGIIQQPAPSRRSKIAGCGCCLIIALAVVGTVVNCRDNEKPASERKVLNASVSVGSDTLTVVNKDDFDWENVHVWLNGRPLDGYKAQVAVLRAGGRKQLSFFEFTNENGDRFSGNMKVIEVWIGGGGYDFAKYPF